MGGMRERPSRPQLHGVYRDLARNRFTWDFDAIPSPQRSSRFARETESVPVLCHWCGLPFWPEAGVTEGWCMEECERAETTYVSERTLRQKYLDALEEQSLDALIQLGQAGRVIVT